MDKKDIKEYIDRYTGRYNEFGVSPETLGWGKNGKQAIRFTVLSEYALSENASVLDVGCGFGDLYKFMKDAGWDSNYHGIDIVPVLLDEAKKLYPEIKLENKDISKDFVESADYVIASGIFNAALSEEPNEDHIERSVSKMFEVCNKAVCVDFMSTYVDFQKEGSWHTSPEWAFSMAKKLSKRVILRNDYMPFEFSLIIFKYDSIDSSVFKLF